MKQYPVMTHNYVDDFFTQSGEIDEIHCPIHDSSAWRWMLGNKVLNFDKRTGSIIVQGHQFRCTPGLSQLIFYNKPNYNNEDEKQYIGINYIKKGGV